MISVTYLIPWPTWNYSNKALVSEVKFRLKIRLHDVIPSLPSPSPPPIEPLEVMDVVILCFHKKLD